MLRFAPAPTLRKPATVSRRPMGAAVAVGAVLGIGFLVLDLLGLPALGWALLGVVAVVALVDAALIAAGRQSPGIVERLLPRRPGGG